MLNGRVIFLDYDGVLNTPDFLRNLPLGHKTSEELDPYKISILDKLCRECGAKVVLTSSWRHDKNARRVLHNNDIPIIGVTPEKGGRRGLEIKQWIKDKHFNGDFIIIDDESSDLTDYQKQRLIYTREPKIVGLQLKHIGWAKSMFFKDFPQEADGTFLTAILDEIENELLRVRWNIDQKEYDDLDPFQNTGNVEGYHNDTFQAHAYDWNWDFEGEGKPPINFKWRDFHLTWYKRMGRGMWWNRPITHDECAIMLKECLASLWEEEKNNDDFYKEEQC